MSFCKNNSFLGSILLLAMIALFSCQNTSDSGSAEVPNNSRPDFDTTEVPSNDLKNAYFGDLHVHTSWSFDAFIYNVRATPDDAYNYAKGEEIDHVSGQKIQLKRPLDFMAVTDHAEYMGIMIELGREGSQLSSSALAKELINEDVTIARQAFNKVGNSMAIAQPMDDLFNIGIIKNTWEKMVDVADKHYEPGKFTTFPAYEWTSVLPYRDDLSELSAARNLHRNVIFRSNKVPERPFSCFDSQDPNELWAWMDDQREKGIELTAIPHNANMSDGLMYPDRFQEGGLVNQDYAIARMRNEPVNEVSQIKGTSMAHPALSPNDEFADFEIYNQTFGNSPQKGKIKGGYVREALKDGLILEDQIGANPYKFGFIGSTDGHNASSPLEEYNYTGKIGIVDATKKRRVETNTSSARWSKWSAGSIAAVWAESNTREAIFDAITRKEVFATTGPRMKVRFFGGWNFEEDQLEEEDWLKDAYANGVTMGGDLSPSSDENAPQFLIWAVKDPESGNLDRVQVVKGWVDENQKSHEKIYNVAWAGDRSLLENGKLAPIGNTVNVETASYENSIGAVSLQTVWTDPDFNKDQNAFYYLRVLEIPTPRWSTYDAHDLEVGVPEDLPEAIQERAWSSPIWYSPAK